MTDPLTPKVPQGWLARHPILFRVLIGLALVVGIGVFWSLLPVAELVAKAQEFIVSLGFAGFGLFALVYVLLTLVFGPAALLSITAGLVWGLATGLLTVIISATLAAVAAALLGRYLLRDRVQAFVARDRRLGACVRAVADGGWRIVMLLRLSPLLPFGVQNYLLSVTDIRLIPYTWATALGILPSSALYVYLGSLGGSTAPSGPLRWALLVLGLVAAALVVYTVARRAQAVLAQATQEHSSSD